MTSTLPPSDPNLPPENWDGFWDDSTFYEASKAPPSNFSSASEQPENKESFQDAIRTLMLIRAFRVRGNLRARLDPLSLFSFPPTPELDITTYGFTEQDLDRPIYIDFIPGLQNPTLRKILEKLQKIYLGTATLEFMHIPDEEQKSWLQERFEEGPSILSIEKQKKSLFRLLQGELFEKFLNKKFLGTKRFSIEGAETLLVALDTLLSTATKNGIEEIVMGMSHRGRLAVLAFILNKPLLKIFTEFNGTNTAILEYGSGDVKYHLGASIDRAINGRPLHLSLCPNPSHLELVDPVVSGRVRAKQDMIKDQERTTVMGLILHGDAAFCGQGIVSESLQLSELKGYHTGGSIHIVINNQIGFTTSPTASRTSSYPTDSAKAIQAPIFHVNADDPEAVIFVCRLAEEFRDRFKKDVVIDLVCYRRHGHNETDEPRFTQPKMYHIIDTHPSVGALYRKKLIEDKIITSQEISEIMDPFSQSLEDLFHQSKELKADPFQVDWLEGSWSQITPQEKPESPTGVDLTTLRSIGEILVTPPRGPFHIHPKLQKILTSKEKMIQSGTGLDWSMAEALAFGSLLLENHPIRFSGQDSIRGTFSQRHATWVDQETEKTYTPLNHLSPSQADFEIINSPLAEASVLGFEVGYAMTNPKALVIWEAQFGDFANGAQAIIDQFIISAEKKWLRLSGIVMLLPHGFEGMGPEHSSARLERYLQMAAEDNVRIANCTTPANYFHILRRQVLSPRRKPLILMTPKSLLRHPLCTSLLSEMGPETHFLPVLSQWMPEAMRLVFCSGKIFYDLEGAQPTNSPIALIRLEELYPFPETEILKILRNYPKSSLIWAQEEPQNMGAWTFIRPRFESCLEKLGDLRKIQYVGRPEAASPATGLYSRHPEEQEKIIKTVFG